MDRSHVITCKSQAHNIFSSCQGFRSSSSGSFSGSSSVSSSGGFSSDGSKRYGSNSYGSSSNGYTSNSGSGSSYSNRGGGNFRKSFGGSSSLAQVLATRSSSGSIMRTMMTMLIKAGPPMKTQVRMSARSLWSPTSLLKHRLKQLRCLFVSHKMSL